MSEVVRFCHPVVEFRNQFNPRTGMPIRTRATIAYQVDGDSVRIGASYCSVKDNFSRKVGREIATERLIASPYEQVIVGAGSMTPREITQLVKNMTALYKLVGRPQEFRKIFVL